MPLDGLTLKRRFRRFLGSSVEFDLAPYMARQARIDRLATEVAATDDAGLTAWARRLKTRVGEGVTLDHVLDELFALVREASERVLGTRPFDEQIVGGLAMHQGKIAEMQTGEGKTLAAVAPVALNALPGHGVHVLTFNDYLARRGRRLDGPRLPYALFDRRLRPEEGMPPAERRAAYGCDVTYVTAREAGFDLLRDGLCLSPAALVHRPFQFALVDEADSILIDEARIPLVIAGHVDESGIGLRQVAAVARRLTPETDFTTDEASPQRLSDGLRRRPGRAPVRPRQPLRSREPASPDCAPERPACRVPPRPRRRLHRPAAARWSWSTTSRVGWPTGGGGRTDCRLPSNARRVSKSSARDGSSARSRYSTSCATIRGCVA